MYLSFCNENRMRTIILFSITMIAAVVDRFGFEYMRSKESLRKECNGIGRGLGDG